MARLIAKPRLELEVAFVVNEGEARALDALVGYGFDEFIEVFKTKLGEHYIRDHENDLRTFFKSIREMMPRILSQMDRARKEYEK